MPFVHTPRVVYNVINGLLKRRRRQLLLTQPPFQSPKPTTGTSSSVGGTTNDNANNDKNLNNDSSITSNNNILGIGHDNKHIYTGRVGMFDIDYLGHMNNAAYLAHCEYARWDMCAMNGLLHAMYKNNINFVLGSASVRFRKEIRPLYKQFVIESYLFGMNDRSMYIVQNFRNIPSTTTTTTTATTNNPNRIMAQVICEGLTIQGRNVIDPSMFLTEMCQIDPVIVDTLRMANTSSTSDNVNTNEQQDSSMLQQYINLDKSMKEYASLDDTNMIPPK